MDYKRAVRIAVALVAGMCWILLNSAPAGAHRVTIFAWVENGTVHTESKFSGGKPVKNAPVTVFDPQEQELLAGETDDQGSFSFAIPRNTALRVVLTASMGHQAHWDIPLEETDPAADETTAAKPTTVSSAPAPMPVGTSGAWLTAAQFEKALNDALARQFSQAIGEIKAEIKAELQAELRRSRDTRPMDIIGGIGYILGLVGLGAYLQYRKKGALGVVHGK